VDLRAASAGALRKGVNVLAAHLWEVDPTDISLVAGPRDPDALALRKGLTNYWKFDEGGDVMTASTLPGGTKVELPAKAGWAPGKHGTAVRLDRGQSMSLTDARKSVLPGAMSLSLWVRIDGGASIGQRPTRSKDGWSLSGLGSHASFTGLMENGKEIGVKASKNRNEPPLARGFEHWVFVYDQQQSEVRLFCNARLRNTQKLPSPLKASPHPLSITADGRGSGTFDEIAIWNRPLSEDEVKMLCNAGRGVELME